MAESSFNWQSAIVNHSCRSATVVDLRRIGADCVTMAEMKFRIETEREVDGRWIADIPSLPGVMVYGATKQEAIAKAEALALRVLADQIEQQKKPTEETNVSFTSA